MRRASPSTVLSRSPPGPAGAEGNALPGRFLLGLFFLDLVLVGARVWGQGAALRTSWLPEAALVILGVATTLGSVAKELPAQNVVLASVIIGALSCGADLLTSALSAAPLAWRTGESSMLLLVWWMPLIRGFAILNSRGVAQALLAPRRQASDYGLWVLGVTVLLTVIFGMNAAMFAQLLRGDGAPEAGGMLKGWCGVPWTEIGAWALTALLITALVTPALLNKRPNAAGSEAPACSPFVVWLGVNLLFLTASVRYRLGPTMWGIALEIFIVTALVARGRSR